MSKDAPTGGYMPIPEWIREKMKNYALLGFALPPEFKVELARKAQYQQDVLQVMAVLPGKHRYEQVEAAINASGVCPRDIYMLLAVNGPIVKFYEALNGPNGDKS